MKNICENCGKEFEDKRYKRFCSVTCARSFATKKINHAELKPAKCCICGKDIYIKKNSDSNKCKCEICKKNRTCHICGTKFNVAIDRRCPNKFCGCNANAKLQQIKTLIKYFGFDKTKLGTLEVENEYNRIRQILYNDLWTLNLTTRQICEKYGLPHVSNLSKIINYLNIPKRNLSDAIVLNYLNNQVKISKTKYNNKQEWHTTWNNKEVFLRSSYELNYAKLLDEQKIDYEVENLRIKYLNTKDNQFHCAIPDFYLKETNTIVEIKSIFTLDVQEMKDKFKAYKELGYNCKLILEHKEVDLYNLKNELKESDFCKLQKNHIPKYKMIKGTFCWIYKFDENNIPINQKCSIKDLPEYEKNGWKKGRIMKY